MIKVQDILLDWKKDSKIDKNKIFEEAIRISGLHAKYLEILAAIKVSLKGKKRKMETLKHHKKVWMAGKMPKFQMDQFGWKYDPTDGVRVMKSEVDSYVKVDPDISALQKEIDELEICRDTVMDIVNKINWRGQDLRIAVDWAKFEAGS